VLVTQKTKWKSATDHKKAENAKSLRSQVIRITGYYLLVTFVLLDIYYLLVTFVTVEDNQTKDRSSGRAYQWTASASMITCKVLDVKTPEIENKRKST